MIDDPDLQQLFEAESAEHLARLDDDLLRLEQTPGDQALLEEAFRESHSLKGAARMLGLSRIEGATHGLESLLNAARKGESPLTQAGIETMNGVLAELRRLVHEALADASPDTTAQSIPAQAIPAEAPPPPDPPLPPPPLPPPSPPPPPKVPPWMASDPETTSPSASPQPAEPPPAELHLETVRVETRRLDELLTQAGELTVIKGRVLHRRAQMDELLERWIAMSRTGTNGQDYEARQEFGRLLKRARDDLVDDGMRLAATAGLIEERVHGMRLLPLSTLFGLFPRMVRDLAKPLGKEVELTLEGGDISVDKRVLEEMKDPLMHLLRNAVDHGLETPAERQLLGKSRAGHLRLVASRAGSAGVTLTVADDGRGLNLDRIRQEAARRHLFDEATLAAMSGAQLQQLILTPGFSTSGFVTELSGRGVGLDVVRVNIERMKGAIHLNSQPGKGLAILLQLPLSLATARLLLARAGGWLCGFPVEYVQIAFSVRRDELFTLEGHAAVKLKDASIIVMRLADLLDQPTTDEPELYSCVVLQFGEQRLGVLVEDLPGEEEVVPRPLGEPLRRVRNVASLAVLPSGNLCVVLNIADLMRSAPKAGTQRHAETAKASPSLRRQSILLVEDSALIRAMEKRILEEGGYEVTTAVDGIDALNKLGSRSFAAVVSDILMPNLDGLGLTSRIRSQSRYQDLPVILVTTLASDDDKRRGLEVGANAYIPKPAFDQRLLLDTLRRLV